MRLYRARIAGVLDRYLEAETEEQAIAWVERSLAEALVVTAEPAADELNSLISDARHGQRRRLLRALNGYQHVNPPSRLAARINRATAHLEELRREAAWMQRELAKAPPLNASQITFLNNVFAKVEVEEHAAYRELLAREAARGNGMDKA